MKYYIGSVNGSGIKANTLGDFIEYLRDMAMTAEEQRSKAKIGLKSMLKHI